MKSLRHVLAALALGIGVDGGAALAQVELSAATASIGNAPHLAISHLAAVARARGIAGLQVTEDQTLTNVILDVAEGRTDISSMPLLLVVLLSQGRGPFSTQGAAGAGLAANLRALYPYNAGGFGLFALESANINNWGEIAGRRVFNGPPRGAALVNARLAINLTAGLFDGRTYQGVQADWADLPAILVDGSVDAFVLPLVHPSERILMLGTLGTVVLVSTPREIFESAPFQRILHSPGNIPIVLPVDQLGYGAGVRVVTEDGMWRAIGTAFAEIVNADMGYQLAYDLTAAHIETLDELRVSTPYAGHIGFGVLEAEATGFCGAMPLRYHPGAVAAWQDHGYEVPDCAEPE